MTDVLASIANPSTILTLLVSGVSLVNFFGNLGKTDKSQTDKLIANMKALQQTNVLQQAEIDSLKLRNTQEEKQLEDYRLIFQNRNPQTIAKYQKLEMTLDKLAEGMNIILDKIKEPAIIEEQPKT